MVCLRLASPCFFFSSYLYLPKSRILQTGGLLLGLTSTRSRPTSRARRKAWSVVKTPKFEPSSATTRTSGTRIRWLIRIWGPRGSLLKRRPPPNAMYFSLSRAPFDFLVRAESLSRPLESRWLGLFQQTLAEV